MKKKKKLTTLESNAEVKNDENTLASTEDTKKNKKEKIYKEKKTLSSTINVETF